MAYSPVEQGRLVRDRALARVAERHAATPAQIALAWLLRQDDMMVIPKATSLDHVRENRAALDLELSKADLAELDKAFPPPAAPSRSKCCRGAAKRVITVIMASRKFAVE